MGPMAGASLMWGAVWQVSGRRVGGGYAMVTASCILPHLCAGGRMIMREYP